jgi:hypothetical protein
MVIGISVICQKFTVTRLAICFARLLLKIVLTVASPYTFLMVPLKRASVHACAKHASGEGRFMQLNSAPKSGSEYELSSREDIGWESGNTSNDSDEEGEMESIQKAVEQLHEVLYPQNVQSRIEAVERKKVCKDYISQDSVLSLVHKIQLRYCGGGVNTVCSICSFQVLLCFILTYLQSMVLLQMRSLLLQKFSSCKSWTQPMSS